MKLSEIILEKDEGKHNNGKTTGFKTVAKKAAAEYGSKEAGDKVAGAIHAKMAKAGKLEEADAGVVDWINRFAGKRSSLLELSTSAGGQHSYYTATLDAANEYKSSHDFSDDSEFGDGQDDDVEDMKAIANAFLKGIPAGVAALDDVDTMIRDYLMEYYVSAGLNPQKDLAPAARQAPQMQPTPPGVLQEMHRQVKTLRNNANHLGNLQGEHSEHEGKMSELLAKCIPHFEKSLESGMQALKTLGNQPDQVSQDVLSRIQDILDEES